MSWYDGLNNTFQYLTGTGGFDPGNPYRNALNANAQQQAQFGQGQMAGLANTQGALQAQMNGQNSVSAEQLRQGLQQAQAQQMSMAAGASPQNQAMAARMAMQNTGSLAAGAMGQQALAGLQERNQAAQLLANSQLQGGLGMYGLSNAGYGTALGSPGKPTGPALAQAIEGGIMAGSKF